MYSFHIPVYLSPFLVDGDQPRVSGNTISRPLSSSYTRAEENGTFTKDGRRRCIILPQRDRHVVCLSHRRLLHLRCLTLSLLARLSINFSRVRSMRLPHLSRGIHKCMRARVPTLKADISRARVADGTHYTAGIAKRAATAVAGCGGGGRLVFLTR